MKVIRGKSALVTGAASGIGRAIALELAREGARLYLLDIDEAGLAAVANEVRSLGVEVETRRCDLAQPAQISAVVHHLLATWGGIDILVNNAGLTYYGRTLNMTALNWDRLLAVNLHAPIQLTRELMPSMLKTRDAHVLNVASILGLVGLARVAAYSTTKFGLVGFSESLRYEFGRAGLGVTALCPGLVDTNLFSSAPRGKDVAAHHAREGRQAGGPGDLPQSGHGAHAADVAGVVLREAIHAGAAGFGASAATAKASAGGSEVEDESGLRAAAQGGVVHLLRATGVSPVLKRGLAR
jgi:short-subunit dehydrogenase